MIDIYEVVKKLIGRIEPVGETTEDNRRFENLKDLTILVNKLVYDIDNVAWSKDSQEYSVKKAGEFASNFLIKELNIAE